MILLSAKEGSFLEPIKLLIDNITVSVSTPESIHKNMNTWNCYRPRAKLSLDVAIGGSNCSLDQYEFCGRGDHSGSIRWLLSHHLLIEQRLLKKFQSSKVQSKMINLRSYLEALEWLVPRLFFHPPCSS